MLPGKEKKVVTAVKRVTIDKAVNMEEEEAELLSETEAVLQVSEAVFDHKDEEEDKVKTDLQVLFESKHEGEVSVVKMTRVQEKECLCNVPAMSDFVRKKKSEHVTWEIKEIG